MPTCRWRGSACSASRKLMEIPNHAWGGGEQQLQSDVRWRQQRSPFWKLTLLRSFGLMLGPTLLASKSTHANVQAMKPVREMVQHSDSETQKMSGEKGWPLGIELDSSEASICFPRGLWKKVRVKKTPKNAEEQPFYSILNRDFWSFSSATMLWVDHGQVVCDDGSGAMDFEKGMLRARYK